MTEDTDGLEWDVIDPDTGQILARNLSTEAAEAYLCHLAGWQVDAYKALSAVPRGT